MLCVTDQDTYCIIMEISWGWQCSTHFASDYFNWEYLNGEKMSSVNHEIWQQRKRCILEINTKSTRERLTIPYMTRQEVKRVKILLWKNLCLRFSLEWKSQADFCRPTRTKHHTIFSKSQYLDYMFYNSDISTVAY